MADELAVGGKGCANDSIRKFAASFSVPAALKPAATPSNSVCVAGSKASLASVMEPTAGAPPSVQMNSTWVPSRQALGVPVTPIM